MILPTEVSETTWEQSELGGLCGSGTPWMHVASVPSSLFWPCKCREDLRPSEAVQASPHSVFRLMFAKTAETLARSGTPRLVSHRVGELPTALFTKIQLETPESRCYRYGYASPEKYLCSGPLAASWQVPKPSAYSARCHPKICRATDAVSALEPFSST